MAHVEILNGDHIPPFPFMIVDGYGLHVDLSGVTGELYDHATVAKIEWGILHPGTGKLFGTVRLKNGQKPRVFWDGKLMAPYLTAYAIRRAEEEQKHQRNLDQRQQDEAKAQRKRETDEAMVRAARAQVEQEAAR